MSEKNITIESLADPKIFRKVLYAIQHNLRHAKTLEGKRELTREWHDFGERIARRLLNHGEYEKALVLYKQLPWGRYSENKYLGMVRALMGLGYYQEAKRVLEKGLKRFPESSCLLLGMGNFYHTIKDFSSSLKYYDLALKHSPNYEYALLSKGNALFGLGYYEDASIMCQQILENFPEEPSSLIMMGNCYLLRGYPEKASVYFKRYLGIGFPGAEAYVGLYFSYREMNLYTDALEIAQECFREYHDHPVSYLILADAYWAKGWENEAKDTLIEGIKRFPDDEGLKELLKEIEDEIDNTDDDKKPSFITILLYLLFLKKNLQRKL